MSITFNGGDRVFNNKKDSSTCLFSSMGVSAVFLFEAQARFLLLLLLICVDAIRADVLADKDVVVVSVLVAFLFLRG